MTLQQQNSFERIPNNIQQRRFPVEPLGIPYVVEDSAVTKTIKAFEVRFISPTFEYMAG